MGIFCDIAIIALYLDHGDGEGSKPGLVKIKHSTLVIVWTMNKQTGWLINWFHFCQQIRDVFCGAIVQYPGKHSKIPAPTIFPLILNFYHFLGL